MGRAGYVDDMDSQWDLIRWRGAVTSAIRGKRGQAFLREMLDALDAMTDKSLIAEELETNGEVCALGTVGLKRGIDMSKIDPEDFDQVSGAFGISGALAREIMFENDEGTWKKETPQERWVRIRKWVVGHLISLEGVEPEL
jgi:hypothetical protein